MYSRGHYGVVLLNVSFQREFIWQHFVKWQEYFAHKNITQKDISTGMKILPFFGENWRLNLIEAVKSQNDPLHKNVVFCRFCNIMIYFCIESFTYDKDKLLLI